MVRIAHMVPRLAHTSLVLIKVLCDTVCTLLYKKEEHTVYHKRKILQREERGPRTRL